MMVKKYQEYINELWSKGLNRSKSNTTRLGDRLKVKEYLKNVEWVDIGHPGYLYAKYDVDDFKDIDEIVDFMNDLPEGVEIVTNLNMSWIKSHLELKYGLNDNKEFELKTDKGTIYFVKGSTYILSRISKYEEGKTILNLMTLNTFGTTSYLRYLDFQKNNYTIKLIKHKG